MGTLHLERNRYRISEQLYFPTCTKHLRIQAWLSMNAPFRTIFHETDWLISWWAISGVCAAVLSGGDLLALLS